jgi:hypothetical protein
MNREIIGEPAVFTLLDISTDQEVAGVYVGITD